MLNGFDFGTSSTGIAPNQTLARAYVFRRGMGTVNRRGLPVV
jgi:hypothetical protein